MRHIYVQSFVHIYIPGGNKGFRQGWMVRGRSSLHCSRWNPNAIHKGASHYPACICHTHTPWYTRAHPRRGYLRLARPEDRVYPDAWRGGAFHGVQSRTYMAANCAATAIRALISHEIVKSGGKFIRRVQSPERSCRALIEDTWKEEDAKIASRIFRGIRKQ